MYARWMGLMAALLAMGAAALAAGDPAGSPLRVGVFAVDATPPLGSPLAYAAAKEVTAPLSCRGVVLLGEDRPVVLCAVDWIGIGNDGQKEFRESLAKVERVASNRRILGPDGKVARMRWTSPRSGELRELPAGTIDPVLRMISLWHGDRPLVALTYYAVHPVSYSGEGEVNTEFPGIARDSRQMATGVVHVHFTGAAGNLNAPKWNDGSPENRQILADCVAVGMARAWQSTRKTPVGARDLGWESLAVSLPPAPYLDEKTLLATLEGESVSISKRSGAAGELVWLRRCNKGDTIDVSCLRLGNARVLHLPGELFVEYQLAAQKLRPDLFVAMAAYGDYGTGYIGTKIGYVEGGYETRPGISHVAPEVEEVLMDATDRT